MTSYRPITGNQQQPGSFDYHWGYGNQGNYEANGAPKSYRPQQGNQQQSAPKAPDMSAYSQRVSYRPPQPSYSDFGVGKPAQQPANPYPDLPKSIYGPADYSGVMHSPEDSERMRQQFVQNNQSPYRPGQAQPVPPQDTGTQYNEPYARPPVPAAELTNSQLLEWFNSHPEWLNNKTIEFARSDAQGSPTDGRPSHLNNYGHPLSDGVFKGGQPKATGNGNLAYAPVDQRPAPFTAQYAGFDGSVSNQPNFGQRDAFIQQINDSMLPYYTGQSQGAPQFNFQDMWSNAGKMVENGWSNPFASQMPQASALEQYLAQYAPQAMYR